MDAVEIRTIAKVSRRLVPFLIICYFVAYLDRVNVGFAALNMNRELGLTSEQYGSPEPGISVASAPERASRSSFFAADLGSKSATGIDGNPLIC